MHFVLRHLAFYQTLKPYKIIGYSLSLISCQIYGFTVIEPCRTDIRFS